jgi:hypothetical protein
VADASKIQGQLLDWTLLDDTASDSPSVDSGELDIGEGAVDVVLNIAVAHKDANAASTNFVTYKVFVKTGANDEDWRLHATGGAGGGTAVKEDVAAQSASAQNRIEVADTTDWNTGLGERLFLLDATLLNSEIVQIFGWVDNDAYLCVDNLTITHENTADLLDGLVESPVSIPNGVRYVKVVFSNADDDANYAVRVDYSGVSAYV